MKRLLLQKLSPSQSGEVRSLLTLPISEVKYPKVTLKDTDFRRLRERPRRSQEPESRFHLNDELINTFVSLVQPALPAQSASKSSGNSVLVMNTFFYQRLTQDGVFNYKNVKRWHRHFNIFNRGLVLFPIHLPGHWALVAFDPKESALFYVDSLEESDDDSDSARRTEVCGHIADYLECEAARLRATGAKGWVPGEGAVFVVADAAGLCDDQRPPQQANLWDCGVFLLAAIYQLANGAAVRWQQADMGTLRGRIALSLKSKKLRFD